MSNIFTNEYHKTIKFFNKDIKITLNKFARQADATVFIQSGDMTVLVTVTHNKNYTENKGFLPLTVSYIEKMYAVGKIPGGYFRREGKQSEKEVLISRLIDRGIRPLFPENFYPDVQIICNLLAHDRKEEADIISVIGASLACKLAGLPLKFNIGAARIGMIDGNYVLNPTYQELKSSKMDIIICGTADHILMVESGMKECSEEEILGAIKFGQQHLSPLLQELNEVIAQFGKPEIITPESPIQSIHQAIEAEYKQTCQACYVIPEKQARYQALDQMKAEIKAKFVNEECNQVNVSAAIAKMEESVVRAMIVSGQRIDKRSNTEIRPIECEVDVLSKSCVHGSAVFTRGETQALVLTTLGSANDEQSIEDIENPSKKERFMLHYNFPPFCVGSVEPLRSPGRREIGHGNLAYRAILPLLPTKEEFPYTIRVVSEILESHGSSSMATVCGASLSLMATSVPLQKHIAGIAMGLVKEDDKCVVLTDIAGDEDFLGDMDFKVAGTEDGVTALQMDMKIQGIDLNIIEEALSHAKNARLSILEKMTACISKPAPISDSMPKIIEIKVDVKKIPEIIGKSGATIKSICEKTGCKVDIENDGKVQIYATTKEGGEMAIAIIRDIITDIQVGKIYTGVVEKLMDFGAIVALPGKKNGLVHISEVSEERIESIESALSVGQEVKVKALGFDEKRRLKLSIKKALGEESSDSDGQSSQALELSLDEEPNQQGVQSGNSDPAWDNPSFSDFAQSLSQKSSDQEKNDRRRDGGKRPSFHRSSSFKKR